jgi:hypothetical protein
MLRAAIRTGGSRLSEPHDSHDLRAVISGDDDRVADEVARHPEPAGALEGRGCGCFAPSTRAEGSPLRRTVAARSSSGVARFPPVHAVS